MGNIDKVVKVWCDGIAAGTGATKRYSGCNVYADGRTIYSYGNHFPMAYIVNPSTVWVNGDTFSVSTSRHQSELRAGLSRVSGIKVVTVPQSALTAANVDYRTIEAVDVKADTWEFTEHVSSDAPAGMTTELTAAGKSWNTETYSNELKVMPISANYGAYDWRTDTTTYPDTVGIVTGEAGKQIVRFDGTNYRWHTGRHWLGDAVFTGIRDRWFDGTVGAREYFISSFDRQERRPLYFLSLLPAPADTFEQALESLSPESVQTATDMGRAVVRQGDMFAIPMDVTTRELKAAGATFAKRKVTVELTRYAKQEQARANALTSILADMPERPVRTYFSHTEHTRESFDAIYKQWEKDCADYAATVVAKYAELYPTLELPANYLAGIDRQAAYKPRQWDKRRSVDGTALYGTSHTATEVATLPDGRQYARGTIYHEPSLVGPERPADHARRTLGKAWHLVARNTVPVSGTGRGRRAI